MMDVLSSFVAWLLMIFLQTTPRDRLAVGDVYRYSLDSQNEVVMITVTGRNDKQGWVSLTAGVPRDKAPLEKVHHAVLTLGAERRVTSFKEDKNELLTRPIVFGPLEKQLMIGTATDYLFKRSTQAPRPVNIKSVAGYKGKLNIKAARYEESQDIIEIGTDPALGLVFFSLTQGGEISGLQLFEVKRK